MLETLTLKRVVGCSDQSPGLILGARGGSRGKGGILLSLPKALYAVKD
jgi:hypothetical protein